MPRLSGSSSVNDIPETTTTTAAEHSQQQRRENSPLNSPPKQPPKQQQKSPPPPAQSSSTATSPTTTTTVAVVRPLRSQSQSVAIQIDQQSPQQQPARAISATSCASDESEESSNPDSLEEGRAPLLRRPHSSLLEDEQGEGSGQRREGGQQQGESPKRRRIPRERYKTGLALVFLLFAGFLNDLVLSFIHDLVPSTDPLPDFAFSHLPYWAGALILSECLMIANFLAMFTTSIAHKHRWVVFRRIFVIAALLYLGRCVTMFATQVPVADKNYYCSPKLPEAERTFWAIFSRAMSVFIGLGLSLNGRHILCGDYIYSGHTIVHVICYLFVKEYSPRRWCILHWLSLLFSTIGVISLLISRGHYSIDIIIAYWISTRIFWLYHTLADLPALRNDLQGRNKMIKTIWFHLFKFMEGNVQRPVPRKYEFPFSMPAPLRRWWQRRQRRRSQQQGGPDMDRLMAE